MIFAAEDEFATTTTYAKVKYLLIDNYLQNTMAWHIFQSLYIFEYVPTYILVNLERRFSHNSWVSDSWQGSYDQNL